MKLNSIAPSRKHCQVSRMSATFSTIKPSTSPIATLTFISGAIVLSPPFSLNYCTFSRTGDVKMAYHYLSLLLGVIMQKDKNGANLTNWLIVTLSLLDREHTAPSTI